MSDDEWDYEENSVCGPGHWPGLVHGKQQSPIDLRLSDFHSLDNHDPIKFVNYHRPIAGEIVNNGHTVQFRPLPKCEPPEIFGGMMDQSYRFVQYHFHWSQDDHEGSEHTLQGLSYPGELHLVHQGIDDPTKLAVLGVFLMLGKDDKPLKADEPFLDQITEFRMSTSVSEQVLELKLPKNRSSFVRYKGSLTTPPCSENVVWTVFTDPITITADQLRRLRHVKDNHGHIIHRNHRPVQELNGREIIFTH